MSPDLIFLTEGHEDLLPANGHIAVGQDPGPILKLPDARRVLVWSKEPLVGVDGVGHPERPHQSFVGARTDTPLGEVDVVCVCIPWADAEVARFGGSGRRWEAHEVYLRVLGGVLAARSAERPLIVAGDFNQYLPRIWGPVAMSELLVETLGDLAVATDGEVPGLGAHVIDHVAHSPDLEAVEVAGWPGRTAENRPLSDHSGVRVDLRLRR